MTPYQGRVTVIKRTEGPVDGYTTVHAMVDGLDTGEFLIATRIVSTRAEIDEIRAQSLTRQQLRAATRAGVE